MIDMDFALESAGEMTLAGWRHQHHQITAAIRFAVSKRDHP
jgi:hypothetical protein